LGQLLQLSGSHQFTQMPIHCRGQACEILSPVDTPGSQFVCQMRSTAS
jgi:hypothetical protein